MGRLFVECLPETRIFKCKCCRVDLACYYDIRAHNFVGRCGDAYLFRDVVNVSPGPTEIRQLISGLHAVKDIYCCSCQQLLGWKYEKAYEEDQMYKEGMYVLEMQRIIEDGEEEEDDDDDIHFG
ncbi:hypothetical protein ACHQM5_025680 [Ranunculus cassubicifolius]